MPYRYVIRKRASNKFHSFYRNVSRKYKHVYSFEQMCKNIADAYSGAYQIENGLLREKPSIKRWEGKGWMAHSGRWFYLYRIKNETIYIIDACHSQNMHEAFEYLKRVIREVVRDNLSNTNLISRNRVQR